MAIHTINGGSNDRRVAYLLSVQGQPRRIAVANVRNDGTNFNPLPPVQFSQQAEYIGFNNFDGGFAFVAYDSNTSTFSGSFVLDSENNPSLPQPIALNPPVSGSISNFVAAIVPLDLANTMFFVAVGFQQNNQTTVYAGTARLGSGPPAPPLEKMETFAQRPNIDSSGVALDRAQRRASILVGADQGIGGAKLLGVDFSVTPKSLGLRPLTTGGSGQVVAGFMAPSVANAGTNGAALLIGDLLNPNVPFGVRVGMVTDDKITSFNVTDLPPFVQFQAIEDLAIDKGGAEWRFFPVVGPQVLMFGRKTNSGNGVNLVWLDNTGKLRAKASGATALVPSEKVAGAAGTFRSPPTAVFGNMAILWLTEGHELWTADVSCQ